MQDGGTLNLGGDPSSLGGPVTAEPGAKLSVAANVPVTIQSGVTLTDKGTVSIATGDVVTFLTYASGGIINVDNGGTLSAVNVQFINNDLNYGAYININAGGQLIASKSTFALNGLNFDIASRMTAGNLSGDTFNQTITVPYYDVQYLAGNASFHAIDLSAGSLNSGTLALNLIGASTNQSYVFPNNFTIGSGATLSVAANVPVTIQSGVTLTDNGTMSFATDDVVTFSTYASGGIINVDNGGTLSAVNVQFINNDLNYGAYININAGGQLIASKSTFALNGLNFDIASRMTAGNLSGDTFNQTITVPYYDVQYLAGNAGFQQVNINAATLLGGQSLVLGQIGNSSSSLQFVFPNGFTVAQGAC